jgi:hypothetical protein
VNDRDPLAIFSIQSAAGLPVAGQAVTNPAPGDGSDQRPDPAPVRPPEPDAADCCGEGCVHCVYDRYDEALERYQLALAAWQARHR